MLKHHLNDRIASVVNGMGYEFVGCELVRPGGAPTLRVYIDSENGITLADCSKVSHQLSGMLDVEDPLPGRYTLEISSPGIDRPLFEIKHFEKYLGYRIKVKLKMPIENRRNFVGRLFKVKEDMIYLVMEGAAVEEFILPFSQIEKANVMSDKDNPKMVG